MLGCNGVRCVDLRFGSDDLHNEHGVGPEVGWVLGVAFCFKAGELGDWGTSGRKVVSSKVLMLGLHDEPMNGKTVSLKRA
ncbi:hypothetical protein Tco_0755755 [Tanacetum coccineum]